MPQPTSPDDKFEAVLDVLHELDTKLAQIQWDLDELRPDTEGGDDMPRLEISPARSLIFADLRRWAKNAAIFAVPVLLLVLSDLQNYVTPDMRHGAILLYLINLILDILRKWQATNRYQ